MPHRAVIPDMSSPQSMTTASDSSRDAEILSKPLHGGRITDEEALHLYQNGDVLQMMAQARALRESKVEPDFASYTMFRVVNYTNFCNVDCSFCSFYEKMDSPRGYTLGKDEIVEKMREAVSIGAHQMFLQGGVNEELPFDYYLDIIRAVKQELGAELHIRAFSPVELLAMERLTGLPLEQVLQELKQAGLDSVPGAGAEILTERMRRILSPKKAGVEEWARVMRICHEQGLYGSANIVFGSEETPQEVIAHLSLVRAIQDDTGGFLSFVPWTFQQQTKRFRTRPVGAPEYLKVLALCRLYLDNIDHIETSLMVLGPGVGSMALHGGADDVSSVVIEENVLRNRGLKSEEGIREFLETSGFTPRKRSLVYRYLE